MASTAPDAQPDDPLTLNPDVPLTYTVQPGDTLSADLNWDINRGLASLTALEILGLVQRVSGGYTAVA